MNITLELLLGVLSIGFLVLLRILQKSKKVKFPALLMIALVLAVAQGLIFLVFKGKDLNLDAMFSYQALGFLASLFTKLMQMMIVPLVFFSILNVVVNQKFNSKSTIIKTLLGFIIVVTVGSLIGFAFSYLTGLGNGVTIETAAEKLKDYASYSEAAKKYTFFGLLSSFIPNNIVTAMFGRTTTLTGTGNVVGIMIFAALLGTSINRTVKKYERQSKSLKEIIDVIFAALTYMTRSILIILPFSIFALISRVVIGEDFQSLSTLFTYTIVVFASMAVLFIIELAVIGFSGSNPIKYVKNVLPALIVAFSTSSSNATLPVTMNTIKTRGGVSEANGTLIPTLATSMGMGACAGIFPVVLGVISLNATNTPITVAVFGYLIFLSIMSSFGTQGIPGTATIAATFVLTGLGLPLGAILLVAPIDFFVDMFRTMINVNGGMTVATIVDKSEGLFDSTVFNAEKQD